MQKIVVVFAKYYLCPDYKTFRLDFRVFLIFGTFDVLPPKRKILAVIAFTKSGFREFLLGFCIRGFATRK